MVNNMVFTKENIIELLKDVYDPEIPILNIVEMGILRDVVFDKEKVIISITPTYSGCPAMKAIEDEIIDFLFAEGIEKVEVKKDYSPPWTTDWFTDEVKKKLKEYGISPPNILSEQSTGNNFLKEIPCPYCNSANTDLTSEFGSTSCKSIHFCNNCIQPFEHFKCI